MLLISSPKFIVLMSLILSLGLSSCSGKREKEKDNNLTVLSAAIGDLNSTLPGGLMIYAHEAGKDLSYSFYAYNGHTTLELDNGSWTFWAVGWKGGSKLVGPVRCGKTSMNLEGGDGTLSLLMNDTRCDDADFASSAFRSSSQFKALKLVTCNSLAGVSGGTSNCSGTKGPAGSYKIKLPQFDGPDSSAYASGSSGIEVCIADAAAGTGITTSTLLLPTGGSAVATSFLTTIVEVHTNATCSALEDSYVFPNGITDTVSGQAAGDVKIYDDTSETVLFLKPSNVTITNPTVALTTGASAITNAASYTVTSTFSENVTGVADVDFTVVNGTASGTAGGPAVYTTTITPSGQGAVNVTFNAGGANAVSDTDPNLISNTLSNTYDSIAPTISLNAMVTINSSNKATYTVSGSCSENTQSVTVSVGGQTPGAQPTCVVGSYSVTYDVSGAGEGGAISILADHDDVAGNSATQASTTVVKDTVIPTVSITSSTNINNVNKASYSVNGTCSENAQTVTILVGGIAPGTQPLCGNNGAGNFVTTYDVSALGDSVSVSITADLDDSAGNSAVQDSINVVKDIITPTVSQVRSTKTDGSYGIGQVVDILVEFSEAITVTGTPQITIDNQGGADFTVNYSSGSTTNTLTFQYTVGATQISADLDYFATNSLILNAGTLNDVSGNASVLTLAAPGAAGSISDNQAIIIDTSVPTITEVKTLKADGTYTTGEVIDIEIVFDEVVNVATGTPQLTLETGPTDAVVNYFSGTGSDTLTFRYTVSANEQAADLDYQGTTSLSLNGATIRDGSLNNATLTLPTPGAVNSISDDKAIVIDSYSPAVTEVNSTKGDGFYKAGELIDIIVLFDEAVNVTGVPEITLDFAADHAVSYSSGSGTDTLTFQYTVQVGHNNTDLDYVGTSSLALNAGTIKDAAGNNGTLTLATPGAASSISDNQDIAIDTTIPTVSEVNVVEPTPTDGFYKAGEVMDVRVIYSEIVNVTGTPQITLDNIGGADFTVDYSAGSGSNTLTFQYTIGAGQSNSDLDYVDTNSLAANGGTIQDRATNSLTFVGALAVPNAVNSISDNQAVAVDTTIPTIFIVSSGTVNGYYNNPDVIDVVFTTSEVVTVTGTPTFTLDTAGVATYSSGSGSSSLTFQYTVADGENSSDLSYADAELVVLAGGTMSDSAGNALTLDTPNNGSTDSLADRKSIIIDTTEPTITNVSSSTANGTYNDPDVIDVVFTVDEAITVTGNPTFTLDTTGIATYTSGSGSTSLTFQYTVADGEDSADLSYADAALVVLAGGTLLDPAGNSLDLNTPDNASGNSLSDQKSIVIDTTHPTISNVSSSTVDGYYNNPDVIDVVFTTSEVVTVTGNPTFTLDTAGVATYSAGSGSTSLTFQYTVADGDDSADLSYSDAELVVLSGGTMNDPTGNALTLDTPDNASGNSLSDQKALVIDTTEPTTPTIGTANGKYGVTFNTSFTASTDTNFSDYRYRLDGVVPTSCADGTSTGGGSVPIPVKTTNNTTQLLKVVACDFAGNISTSAASTYTWLEPTTAHFYTNTSNWNQWIINTTPGTAGAALCAGTGECLHGGQVLKVPVPELTSCTGLTASDNLGVFTWACDDAGSTSVTFTNHAGFIDGKGLADLLNAATWKSFSLDISSGSFLSTVSSKVSATIWGNAVGALPGSTTAGTRASLATANKIYTHSSTDLIDASYDITADGVGVVNIGGAASEIRTANSYTAYDLNDLTITGGLDSSALVVSKGRKYLWVESNFNCDSPDASQTTDNGVYFHTTHYSTIHHTKIYDTLNWGLRFRDSDYNMVTNLISEGHFDTATNAGASTGASIRLELGSDNNKFYKFDVYDAFAPIWIDNGASNKFKSFKVAYGNENGIYIGAGNNNNFQDGIVTSTFDTTFGQGIYTVGVSDTIFIGVTSANNDLNINLEGSNSALLINTTMANGRDAADGGLLVDGTALNNTFLRTVSVNNAIGMLFNHSNTVSINSLYDFSVADNGIGISIPRANAQEIVSGQVEFENNTTSCSASGGSAGIDGSCTANSGNTFAYIASSGLTSANSFYGIQATPTFASIIGTDSWVTGLTNYEGYGGNGASFGAQTPCSTGTCALYDWRLITGVSPLKNQFPVPPATNGGVDNLTHTFVGEGAVTFLRYATEVNPLDYHTFTGDQDGICENNEVCIINPNFGAYQGHGNLVDTPTDTSAGTLNNIKLLQWDTNGL